MDAWGLVEHMPAQDAIIVVVFSAERVDWRFVHFGCRDRIVLCETDHTGSLKATGGN